ncbi:MAG: ATP-binding cassette domain-containing protein [Solirubrobacterales bacterium]|nr:ATP-binding cassette domain-containing protein [Solirubrobacterales bacterium]
MVALCGPSGSGKSTLLLLAAALLAPDAGAVRFGQTDLSRLSTKEISDYQRHSIGLISQTLDLFPGVPALENAAIKLLADRVPLPEARRTARPWLERVGLGDRLSHTPDQLSGGERARVAVARALVNQPRLLLADEPTANLDTRRGLEVVDLLASAAREQDVAVLLVTHDQEAAAVADRIETLRDGSLGSPMPLDRTAIS